MYWSLYGSNWQIGQTSTCQHIPQFARFLSHPPTLQVSPWFGGPSSSRSLRRVLDDRDRSTCTNTFCPVKPVCIWWGFRLQQKMHLHLAKPSLLRAAHQQNFCTISIHVNKWSKSMKLRGDNSILETEPCMFHWLSSSQACLIVWHWASMVLSLCSGCGFDVWCAVPWRCLTGGAQLNEFWTKRMPDAVREEKTGS